MEAYEALAADGQHLGGAIIVIKADEHRGELAFLYVKVGVQSKGIGQTICTSRSFEGMVHDAGQLEMFISNYAAHCAQKLRAQHQIELQSGSYEVLHQFKPNTYFLAYYRKKYKAGPFEIFVEGLSNDKA